MSDAATRERLRRFSARTFGAKLTPPPPAPAEPRDERPRYKTGELRDLRSHLEETIAWDLVRATDDPRSAPYRKAHEAEIDLYQARFGALEQAERFAAKQREQIESAAARLGIAASKLSDFEWCLRNGPLLSALEQRANQKERHAELSAELEQPLPEEAIADDGPQKVEPE